LRLIDLRDRQDPEPLQAFVRLYDRTFTEPSEREDPSQWPERLWGQRPPGKPVAHLLLALDGPGGARRPPFRVLPGEPVRHPRWRGF
jgi:hypothetical protein